MSDSTLTGNAPVRQNITRKNVIIGLLLLLFVLIPGSVGVVLLGRAARDPAAWGQR